MIEATVGPKTFVSMLRKLAIAKTNKDMIMDKVTLKFRDNSVQVAQHDGSNTACVLANIRTKDWFHMYRPSSNAMDEIKENGYYSVTINTPEVLSDVSKTFKSSNQIKLKFTKDKLVVSDNMKSLTFKDVSPEVINMISFTLNKAKAGNNDVLVISEPVQCYFIVDVSEILECLRSFSLSNIDMVELKLYGDKGEITIATDTKDLSSTFSIRPEVKEETVIHVSALELSRALTAIDGDALIYIDDMYNLYLMDKTIPSTSTILYILTTRPLDEE